MVDRRGFLKGTAAGVLGLSGAAAVTSGCTPAPAPPPIRPRGPFGDAGIDHVIVVMMENRSFDHFLGWLPGANGVQDGLTYTDDSGREHATHHLDRFGSCGWDDPAHSYKGGRQQLNGGAIDGFLRGATDLFPIGYYTADDLPFWGPAAPAWTVCDNYFSAILGPTYPNRFFQHCGQTDRWENWMSITSMTTIWDLIAAAGLEGRYYYSDAPFSALLGVRHASISRMLDGFLADCATGRLPHVSFVDPSFMISPIGTSNDYHPHSDIRLGDQFLHRIYEAVTNSPAWERTVLVVNFDEWGGFYDHVVPPVGPSSTDWQAQRGFRVPCLVVSPFARRGHVAHDLYDHASVLRMIEWGFDLPALSVRDAEANNLADVLDLSSPDPEAPHWDFPSFTPESCFEAIGERLWEQLRQLADGAGFA